MNPACCISVRNFAYLKRVDEIFHNRQSLHHASSSLPIRKFLSRRSNPQLITKKKMNRYEGKAQGGDIQLSNQLEQPQQNVENNQNRRRRRKKKYVLLCIYILGDGHHVKDRRNYPYEVSSPLYLLHHFAIIIIRFAVSTRWEREVAENGPVKDCHRFCCCCARRLGNMFVLCERTDGTPIVIAGPCWPFCLFVTLPLILGVTGAVAYFVIISDDSPLVSTRPKDYAPNVLHRLNFAVCNRQ